MARRILRSLIALLLLTPIASAAEFHVTTTGSGSACTLGAPCATIAAAVAVAGASDTIWIHAGTYDEAIDTDALTFTSGSSWDTRLVIAEFPGDEVILRPTSGEFVVRLAESTASYIELRGFEIDAGGGVTNTGVKITFTGADTNASHHIRLHGLEIHSSPLDGLLVTGPNSTFNEFIGLNVHENVGHGVYISTADNLLIGSDVWGHAGSSYGVHVFNAAAADADRNRILFNRTYQNASSGILVGSGTGNEVRGNRAYDNGNGTHDSYGIFVFSTSVDASVTGNWTWGNEDGHIFVDPGAAGTVSSGNFSTEPATAYRVTNNPYAGVDWGTILHCQSQHHEHAFDSARITSSSNAGYCAATAMHYQGVFQANAVGDWITLGSPNPDPGVPVGWDSPRRWPPTDFGFPSVPLNSLRFYLPGAEDIGLFSGGSHSEHFFALGLTTYMEGAGCTSCGNSGSAVRTHNPLGLTAGQIFGTNQEFVNDATVLGAMVTLNHPAGAPSSRDTLDPFPRAVEIFNTYHQLWDEGSANDAALASNPGSCTPQNTTFISEFQALWDHVLETKSARIWGVAVNDWAGAWLATGTPSTACWPEITTANRDRGKLDVLVSAYDLASYLDAFDRGAFFAVAEDNATKSAYPVVTGITVTATSITIETAAMDETVVWTADGLEHAAGYTVSLADLPADLRYIRAEIDDGEGRVLFTQPFELGLVGALRGAGFSGGGIQ